MSDDLASLVAIIIAGALMLFFFGAARAAGKPVPRERRTEDEGPYVGPWGILESRKRDPDLEWDEIAFMDDEIRRDEEEEERDWLDEPGDDRDSGWTNFDYIAADEMDDEWDGDE